MIVLSSETPSRHQLQKMIEAVAEPGSDLESYMPFFLAAQAGRCTIVFLECDEEVPWTLLNRGPVLVILVDSDDASTGPKGWGKQLDALRAWARGALVLAVNWTPARASLAVEAAVISGAILLVLTDPPHALEWGEALEDSIPTMVIATKEALPGGRPPAGAANVPA